MRGVGRTGAAVWRRLACLVFLRGSRIFAEKGRFSTWGRKSVPLKTSLDVFKARKLLELARVSALLRNAVTRHSEGADSAADFTGYAIAADPTRYLTSIEECGGELRSLG